MKVFGNPSCVLVFTKMCARASRSLTSVWLFGPTYCKLGVFWMSCMRLSCQRSLPDVAAGAPTITNRTSEYAFKLFANRTKISGCFQGLKFAIQITVRGPDLSIDSAAEG